MTRTDGQKIFHPKLDINNKKLSMRNDASVLNII